jgi:hypothetical protein
MKISHEIPKQLFPYHNLISDYPYILGHLLSLDKDYANFYKRKLQESNFSILDNSAFELGKSINPKEYLELIKEYRPTHFILPDVLHDMKATIDATEEFNRIANAQVIGKLDFKIVPIGVLQGNSFQELFECFDYYITHTYGIKHIAIPFDCIKNSDWHNIRAIFFKELIKRQAGKAPFVNIHFLGIENPSELLLYSKEELSCIGSIDTSSPIINGWLGKRYTDYGIAGVKPKEKLADNLERHLIESQIEDIVFNVKKFKELCQIK